MEGLSSAVKALNSSVISLTTEIRKLRKEKIEHATTSGTIDLEPLVSFAIHYEKNRPPLNF